jgi:hypothetical protein
VQIDAQWSRWRSVTVPIAGHVSVEEHLLLERTMKISVAGFRSMPEFPFGRVIMLTIGEPRSDLTQLTQEIDFGIERANQEFAVLGLGD